MNKDWNQILAGIRQAISQTSAEKQEQLRSLAWSAEILLIQSKTESETPVEIQEIIEELLAHISPYTDPDRKISFCFRVARWAVRAGSRDFALKMYESIMAISQEAQNLEYLVQSLEETGEIFRKIGEFVTARQCQCTSLELAEANGLPELEAHAKNNLAVIEVERGNLVKAKTLFFESLVIAESVDEIRLIGHIYNNLGVVQCILGEPDKAYADFNRALVMREQVGDQKGIAETCHNIGKSLVDRNVYEDAESFLNRAQEIARRLNEKGVVADILLTRAELMIQLKMYEIAAKSAEEALRRHRELDDPFGIADALRLSGCAYRQLGDLKLAKQLLEQSLSIFTDYQHPFGIASAATELLYLFSNSMESPNLILKYYELAKASYLQIGNKEAVKKLNQVKQRIPYRSSTSK